jgi:hypothetical protein
MVRPTRCAQTHAEAMMPCAEYEALEAHCQAQCEGGIPSYEKTDHGNNDNVEDVQEDLDDPAELDIIEARQSVLLFCKGAAQALYDDQMIMTLNVLKSLMMIPSRILPMLLGRLLGMLKDSRFLSCLCPASSSCGGPQGVLTIGLKRPVRSSSS